MHNDVLVHLVEDGIFLPTAADMVVHHLLEHQIAEKSTGVHMDLGVLVVDIDAWDCSVVEEILHRVKPLVMVVEMAFHIPPPFRFSMQYAERSKEQLDNYDVDWLMPASGCSLSFALHAFRPHGYFLLRITGTDAIFVHAAATPCLEAVLGARFPIDEFSCYRRSQLWMQAPAMNVRDWFFAKHPSLAFGKIWSNLTRMNQEGGRAHQPFTFPGGFKWVADKPRREHNGMSAAQEAREGNQRCVASLLLWTSQFSRLHTEPGWSKRWHGLKV
eukprot:3896360-Amphidinium_carterae.1